MSKDKQEVNKDVQWWAPVVGDQELRLGLRGPGTKPLPPRKSLFSPSITSFVGGEVSPDWKGVAGRGGGIRPGPAQVALVVKNLPARWRPARLGRSGGAGQRVKFAGDSCNFFPGPLT